MTPVWIALALALLIAACVTVLYVTRRPPPEVAEWTEHYHAPRQEPRAVTRIRKDDLYWEI